MAKEIKKYDYVIVGSGLFGATFAYKAKQANKKVLVIDKRKHIGGNIYTENKEGINVHKYGAHIFHTDDKEVWDFVNNFVEFNRYTNCPIANYKGRIYNMPFNMNTFTQIFDGVVVPEDAKRKIEQEKQEIKTTPKNLEEQAISLVGRTIYEKLIKGYTEKQWGKSCKDLPPEIIKRLPVRYIYDNNYFNDKYQGIPIGGYTKLIEKMLDGVEVILEKDFFEAKPYYEKIAKKIVYTGKIDEFFNYKYGELEYRSLRFETKIINKENYQGNAVVNYTDKEIPYTRVIEHKHFEFIKDNPKTIITFEYPDTYTGENIPYYVVNDDRNNLIAEKYRLLSNKEKSIIFGGRLAEYRYYDMDDVIRKALDITKKEFTNARNL